MPPSDGERYQPLPPLLKLPGHFWRKLSRRAKIATAIAGVVAAVGSGLLIDSMVRTGDRVSAEERERTERRRAQKLRALKADQRPRRAPVPAGASLRRTLERGIDRDVRRRVAAGTLAGPPGTTTCTSVGRAGITPTTRSFNCFAQVSSRRSTGRTIISGQRFVARADLRRDRVTWCKANPRPLHPDTADFVTVPISPACLPPESVRR